MKISMSQFSKKTWIGILIVLSLVAIGFFADNREDLQKEREVTKTESSQKEIRWVQVAKYQYWRIKGKFELEPVKIESGEFRIRWSFATDIDSLKSLNNTIYRLLKDRIITTKTHLVLIKLVNYSHIRTDSKEVIYYRFFGIELSPLQAEPWEEVVFGTVFKPYSISGNILKGEAYFKGKGKIGIYIETHRIISDWYFSASSNWELIVEEKKAV
jgi:hypothetical protein